MVRFSPALAGIISCSLLTGSGVVRPVTAGAATPGAPIFAYVASDRTNLIWPLDTQTSAVGQRLHVGPGGESAIAITADDATAYVADAFDDVVTPVALATRKVGTPIAVGRFPVAIAIAPDGFRMFVANEFDGTITTIDTATNQPGTPIVVGGRPTFLAMTPDGKTLFVADSSNGSVTPVDVATGTAQVPIALPGSAGGIAIAPDGRTLYVSMIDNFEVVPIDVATRTTAAPIIVCDSCSPVALQVTPDGRTLFVGDDTGFVTPVDVATRNVGSAIYASGTTDLEITPDGKTVFVSDGLVGSRTVRSFKVGASVAGPLIRVGDSPGPIVFTPDQAPHAAISAVAGAAGTPTGFDATASTVQFGTIVRYRWSFGDGATAATTKPRVSHTYATRGSYSVSVTEVDSAGTSTRVVYTGRMVLRDGGPEARATATVVVH